MNANAEILYFQPHHLRLNWPRHYNFTATRFGSVLTSQQPQRITKKIREAFKRRLQHNLALFFLVHVLWYDPAEWLQKVYATPSYRSPTHHAKSIHHTEHIQEYI